jgi:hypothetical protein
VNENRATRASIRGDPPISFTGPHLGFHFWGNFFWWGDFLYWCSLVRKRKTILKKGLKRIAQACLTYNSLEIPETFN